MGGGKNGSGGGGGSKAAGSGKSGGGAASSSSGGAGKSLGSGTMKAPGADHQILRSDFENNPAGYFQDLHKK
ncbi:hypothetical protein LINPERPRIM_LOCUS29666 [Linum perenne]